MDNYRGSKLWGRKEQRKHAVFTPRFLGCAAIIAKSFARIHETNLKKQGILALTFTDPRDYDKIMEGDKLSIVGLKNLEQGKPVSCRLRHEVGKVEEILLSHSYSTSH